MQYNITTQLKRVFILGITGFLTHKYNILHVIGGAFMKKYLFLFAIMFIGLLTACSSESSNEEKVTVNKLITAFTEAGLEAEDPTELDNKEFGNTREEGMRILVPSLGEDAGGRVFEFKNKEDMEKAKSYYDELSAQGPLFYSHTYSKGNFLLQMNGDMEDGQFEKYKKVMDEVIK